jgi:hypothetical protein
MKCVPIGTYVYHHTSKYLMYAYIKSKFYIKSGRFDVEPNSPTSNKIGAQQCKTMHNNAPDAIAPCCNLKWRVLVDLSRPMDFKPSAATNALKSSYQTDRLQSRPALASRWAVRPPRRARTKSLRRRQRLLPAAAKVGKIGL